jgi:hypothetical protein
VRGCEPCAEFRASLKATRSRLRQLIPPIGFGPLAGLLGGGGGAATSKFVAAGCCAVLAAGGATAWVAGQRDTIRGESPAAEAGGKAVIGQPIRAGTRLPPSVAMSTLTVRLPAGEHTFVPRVVRVTCPAGMGAEGMAQARTQDGRVANRYLRMLQVSRADHDAIARGRGRRTTVIQYAAARLDAPVVVRLGTICKRR